MAEPLLRVAHLRRLYASSNLFGPGKVTVGLDDVSFEVQAGRIFGIVGESGCGKSTLARLIMALDKPTSGDVIFEGDSLFSLTPTALKHRRRDFQMVFQDPFGSLDPRQSIRRIVAEPLHVLDDRLSRTEREALVRAMLDSVGIGADALERYPHQFSGGQRQRIAIARALVTQPKLVVADEAVSALDLSVQAQVLNLILDLRDRKGVTVVFVTHNLAVIDCIADDVAVMYLGRIVEMGPAGETLDHPRHPYTRLLAEAEPSIHQIGRPQRGRALSAGGRPPESGCAFHPRCPFAQDRCRTERPLLRTTAEGRQVACHFPLE